MKKSLLALAVLGAFAGVASAQSSVTMYGRVDLSVGKGVGTADKRMVNGSGSRLGMRGVEDLGGGLSALFQIEHRFNADTGAAQNFNICTTGQGNPSMPVTSGTVTVPTTTPGVTATVPRATGGNASLVSTNCTNNRFWGARSIVGLQGGFGQVVLGREYTTAFLQSQLVADPWGWDTVVSGTMGNGLNDAITGGGIARVRNDSSLTYRLTMSGFTFGAQIAEATDEINRFQDRPVNAALSYAGGPFSFALAYERTGQEVVDSADWMTINGAYNFGAFKLGALFGRGDTAAGTRRQSWLVTGTAPIGAGELRASYGVLRDKTLDVDIAKGFALGYHYSLSKRTTVYADVVRNNSDLITSRKTGYDFGIKHNF